MVLLAVGCTTTVPIAQVPPTSLEAVGFVREGLSFPKQEEMLKADGSYPSGHAAFGWMLALVLTDLVPEKQDQLLKRGYAYGQSRVVCRAHWQSDTTAGRVMASATFARLQSDPTSVAQLGLARTEMAKSK